MHPDTRDQLISGLEDELELAERVVDYLREQLILAQTQRAIFNREHSEMED